MINALLPEGSSEYELSFVALYFGNLAPMGPDTVSYTGSAAPGTVVLAHDPTPVLPPTFTPDEYYYEALLRVQCSDGDWSEVHRFYVSPFSLLNNPSVNCNIPFTSFIHLIDGAGFSYAQVIEAEEGDSTLFVDDLSILVDIGHSYIGDLSITLTSPQGTEVELLSYPNFLGNSSALSLIFSDNGDEVISNSGIVAPAQPLSDFAGEPAAGTWLLEVVDNLPLDDGYLYGGCLNINTLACSQTFSGKVFYDFNANGIQDENEPGYGHAILQNTADSSYFFSSSSGTFNRCAALDSFDLQLVNVPNWYISQPASHSLSFDGSGTPANADFALQPDGEVADLFVYMSSLGFDRPGFENSYLVSVSNQGNICVDNVVLEVALDELLSLQDLSGADVFSLSENTASAELGSVCPAQTVEIVLHHSLPDTVALGTELQSSVVVTPTEGDGNPDANSNVLTSIVVGSYDPNDKQVNRAETDQDFKDAGDYLYYHIRFQNTGTFYAEFVIIADSIDPLLVL